MLLCIKFQGLEIKMDKEILVNGKLLKCGFTTGACAQAAAKACALMIKNNKIEEFVEIELPDGSLADFKIEYASFSKTFAKCAVKKYAGDDPDVTDGVYVYVSIQEKKDGKICFVAGEGVGTVIKSGLFLEIGEAAINPVPREYIKKEIINIFGRKRVFSIEISIPDGELISKKTFNSRIGVEGGLSILGTTGRVKPMSNEALQKTILLEIKQKTYSKPPFICLVLGNYGEKIADTLNIPKDRQVMCSNFIGYAVDALKIENIKKVLIIGHIGKISKVSAGIFNTHSHIADARAEVFAAKLLDYGRVDLALEALRCNTTEQLSSEIIEKGEKVFFDFLTENIKSRIEQRVLNEVDIEVLTFSFNKGILGFTGETFKECLSNETKDKSFRDRTR